MQMRTAYCSAVQCSTEQFPYLAHQHEPVGWPLLVLLLLLFLLGLCITNELCCAVLCSGCPSGGVQCAGELPLAYHCSCTGCVSCHLCTPHPHSIFMSHCSSHATTQSSPAPATAQQVMQQDRAVDAYTELTISCMQQQPSSVPNFKA
jgi:hypothetical protein